MRPAIITAVDSLLAYAQSKQKDLIALIRRYRHLKEKTRKNPQVICDCNGGTTYNICRTTSSRI